MSRWDSISITAHYTAQIWVRNGFAWAWPFDTPQGRLMYSVSDPLFQAATRSGLNTPVQFCVQRHRIIDQLVTAQRPGQIVELAGGLSPRCLAFAQKYRIPCVDVDLPRMVGFKSARLADLDGGLPVGYRQRPLDLMESQDYAADLGLTGADLDGPTVVITEGILSYFSGPQRRHILGRIAHLLRACGGGVYITDIHHQEAVDRMGWVGHAFRTGLHFMSRTMQARLIQDLAEGRAEFEGAGFSGVTAHDPADYADALGLVVKDTSSGLSIYEAAT